MYYINIMGVYIYICIVTSIDSHLTMFNVHASTGSPPGWMGDRPLPECQRLGFREEGAADDLPSLGRWGSNTILEYGLYPNIGLVYDTTH